MDDHASLIADYYSAFSATPDADFSRLRQAVAADWTNTGSPGDVATYDQFVPRLAQLQQAVPDLVWTVHDVLVAGDRIVVRGEGAGTPVAPLFGAPVTGVSFRILSIDIHVVEDGRIARTHHLEDWAGALAQLSAQD